MARWFNIGGPCIAAKHYMLPAAARLPEVMSLIRKEQYFVVHAQRQCGKTTAFRALMDEINAKGEIAAFYCSLETAQEFPDPAVGLPLVYRCICGDARRSKLFPGCSPIAEDATIPSAETSRIVNVPCTISWSNCSVCSTQRMSLPTGLPPRTLKCTV